MRLDAYLAQYWPDISRSTWQKRIAAGQVRVNGEIETTAKKLLGEDDVVTFDEVPQPDLATLTLPILYEDDAVVVINKPIGVLSHAKGIMLEESTVASWLQHHLVPDQATAENNRRGIVHRLDRATSGVMIAAKDDEAARYLQKQFQDRKAKKTYLALVHGLPKEPSATIRLPIERNPRRPQTFRVGSQGKPAETAYQVLDTYNQGQYSLVELRPLTGRTHQLRVHLAYINCPIVGDTVYGQRDHAPRLMLHASQLEITLPSRQRQTFVAEQPRDFIDFLLTLHKDTA